MSNTLWILIVGSVALAAALRWIVKDFAQWTSLGPGGLPHSPAGWLAMSFLRLWKRDGRSTRQLARAAQSDDQRYLGNLLRRQGRRPAVAPQPIPQRQLDGTASPENLARLKELFNQQVQQNREVVHYARSFLEKHQEAITLIPPECGPVCALMTHGEIAHIHPSDGSMHMVLSPLDAKTVIDSQWGELHSLAGRFQRLPMSYTFVYAPRTDADFQAIGRILSASVAFMARRDSSDLASANVRQPPDPHESRDSLRA